MKTLAAILTAFIVMISPARAEQVDVELVLAVDVSGSMQYEELVIQRRGYVEAFRSPQVHEAIRKGLIGSIAVTYVEWARDDLKQLLVPWMLIDSPEAANAFANRLESAGIANMRNTSITGAINWGATAIESNEFEGMRRVIDISGDGPNNQGGLVTRARDEAVEKGIIINGLPLMVEPWLAGLGFNISGLDEYYRECVIGGPGAFVLPVEDWDNFAEAVRRKIVLELAADPPPAMVIPVHRVSGSTVDCQIGEKLRRINEW